MLRVALRWLERRGSHRRFNYPDGSPYLDRYFLLRTPWGGIMLHRFWGSDLLAHNHPWNWRSFVLSGEFTEVIGVSFPRLHLQRRFGLSPVMDHALPHCYAIEPEWVGKVWTLFFYGQRRGGFGFWSEGIYHELEGRDSASSLRGTIFPRMVDSTMADLIETRWNQ